MIASLDALQSATALIAQHNETGLFGVVLQFDNGLVWMSEDTFKTREEAQLAFDAWVDEIGGSQQKFH